MQLSNYISEKLLDVKSENIEDRFYTILSDDRPDNQLANELHHILNKHYKKLMSHPKYYNDVPDNDFELDTIRLIENAWNKHLDDIITQTLPTTPNEFIAWYKLQSQRYAESVRPFFNYFGDHGTIEDLALYLKYEQEVDGSFDDIVSYAQIGLSGKPKMVLAENYWDEMGNGRENDVHTWMFSESLQYICSLLPDDHQNHIKEIPTDILANGNMLLMYASRKKLHPRLLGAIGILEDTAPERFQSTVKLMKRLKINDRALRYHEIHIHCDCKHGSDIFEHVLLPTIIGEDVNFLHEICRGILTRIYIATKYYDAMKHEFSRLALCRVI